MNTNNHTILLRDIPLVFYSIKSSVVTCLPSVLPAPCDALRFNNMYLEFLGVAVLLANEERSLNVHLTVP